MKKIFLMLQAAVLTAGTSAYAFTGGPFENSDAGILLERGSFYQASFTFSNGNGYAIWTPDAFLSTNGALGTTYSRTTLTTPATDRALTDHNGNRSVFYYKGVSYAGGAFGEVDIDARTIQGICNAEADFGVTSSTQSTNANLLSFSQSNTTINDTVVRNNRSYVLNIGWQGKIYQRSPVLRFSGKGELAIISPSGRESIAGLAYSGYAGLINSINNSVSNLFGGGGSVSLTNVNIYQTASDAIQGALADLVPYVTGTGPTNNYEESETKKVRVKGLRRYF